MGGKYILEYFVVRYHPFEGRAYEVRPRVARMQGYMQSGRRSMYLCGTHFMHQQEGGLFLLVVQV